MALTDRDRERIRYHLGYPSVSQAASLSAGIPVAYTTMFLVESAMDRLLAVAEDRVQAILSVMDGIDDKLIAAQCRVGVEGVDTIKLRDEEPDKLEREYWRWSCRLADILAVGLYPYSARFAKFQGGGTNIPVRSVV